MPRSTSTKNRQRRRKSAAPSGLAAFFPEATFDWFADPHSPALRSVKRLIGIALLPLCWVLLETFLVLLRADTLAGDYWKSREFVFFGVGCAIAAVLCVFARGRVLRWIYVAGHELTHALFVVLFRGQVSDVRITAQGGHIMTDRTNFLISLSPYFFPFYSVVAILVWVIYGWIVGAEQKPEPVWLYGLIGLTWTFHLLFTLFMVAREQPDVRQNGRVFSFSIIFSANVLILSAMLIVASPTASFRSFAGSLIENGRTFGPRLAESLREVKVGNIR